MGDKNIWASTELKLVHDRMDATYRNKLDKGIKAEMRQAKEIEKLLRMIKTNSYKKEETSEKWQKKYGFIGKALLSQAQDIWEKSAEFLNNLPGAEGFGDNLFKNTHSETRSFALQHGADDIAEIELAAVISAIENYANAGGKKENFIPINLNGKLTGKDLGTIKGVNILTESKWQEHTIKSIEREIKKLTEKDAEKIKELRKIQTAIEKEGSSSRSGKADVIADITITAEVDNPFVKLAKLFKGKRFTVKNYNSKGGTDDQSIHLGHSDPYKAIVGQLQSLGYSYSESTHMFYHWLNSWLGNTKSGTEAVEIHVPHLRFAYELEGNSLINKNGDLLSADFLVVNDPSSNNIFVKSTKSIVGEILTGKDRIFNPFSKSIDIKYSTVDNKKVLFK